MPGWFLLRIICFILCWLLLLSALAGVVLSGVISISYVVMTVPSARSVASVVVVVVTTIVVDISVAGGSIGPRPLVLISDLPQDFLVYVRLDPTISNLVIHPPAAVACLSWDSNALVSILMFLS